MYDLTNIFEVFLPQLLLYPNPTDPLNAEAAALQLKNEEDYHKKIKDYVTRHAMPKGSSNISVEETKEECKTTKENPELEKKLEIASTNPTNEKEEDDDYVEKKHDSELSATSDIEMMDIEDDDDP